VLEIHSQVRQCQFCGSVHSYTVLESNKDAKWPTGQALYLRRFGHFPSFSAK